ncbi:hypothetical protein AB9F45_35695, partial [Rhizobium leguminosarum]
AINHLEGHALTARLTDGLSFPYLKLPEGLYLYAYLPREDIRDAVIGRTARKLIDLPHDATVGSSSLRRQALIRRMRTDINVITFRGLVETRLRKL